MSRTVNEREFIRELTRQFPIQPPVEVGIGDDGAVLTASTPSVIVVTDMLLDGVHFDLRSDSVQLAGRKAVAVNLSDLAAMGCRPTAAFVSLAVPRQPQSPTFLNDLYGGIGEILTEFKTTLAGGDTNSWDGPFAINVCLTGSPFGAQAILRSTAQPNQHIYVTGPLGGSFPTSRHMTFRPRLTESEWLISHLCPQAMMDISDGLSIDVLRLAEASGVGVELFESSIPIHADVDLTRSSSERLHAALSDGEDFELLLVLSEEQDQDLNVGRIVPPFSLHKVGRTTASETSWLIASTGERKPLVATGWQHL